MKNYLIDRMAVASPSFKLTRKLLSDGKLRYTIIEEISYESRNDKDNSKLIKKESTDNVTTSYIDNLKAFVPDLINLGIVKPDEGCGDAMLIAEYLSSGTGEQQNLFEEDYPMVIVTDDGKLREYCKRKDIDNISSEDFFKQCDNIKG